MYPHERSLVSKMADKPFVILGVNSDRSRETVKKAQRDENLTWRSFWNGPNGTDGPISRDWGIRGWPTLVLIDAKGVIRNKWLGSPRDPNTIDRAVEGLLKEAEAAQ
jgi:hypothetical protein